MHPSNVLERRGAALAADLRLLDAPALIALDLPPREPVIGPLLRGSVTLLRAAPGLGKSWLALSLAHAAAAGGKVGGWAAPRPARVLYVDAQMSLALLQARLAAIAGFAAGASAAHPSRRPGGPPRDEDGGGGEGARKRRRKTVPRDEVIVAGPTRRTILIAPPQGQDAAAPSERPAAAAPASPQPLPGTLRVLAAEAQALPMPDLGAESGRAAFRRLLFAPPDPGDAARPAGECPINAPPAGDLPACDRPAGERPACDLPAYDLVVLDGLSALLRSARGRNDPAREFAEFLSGLRRAGLAVLLVERQRPRRRISPPYEDLLDAVIAAKRPPGLGEAGPVHMALTVSGRALEETERFELRLELGTEAAGWRRVARLEATVLAAWRLERQGLSCRAIGKALGVAPATAWRLVRRAEALPAELLEAAVREMEGDLLPPAAEVETAATVATGETPEPDPDSPDWLDWQVRRIEDTIAAELNGVTKAEAARRWGAVLQALKVPPGVFFQGERWKAMDRAILDRFRIALDAPERPPRDDFSDVPSLRDALGRGRNEPSAKPDRYTSRARTGGFRP